MLNNSILDKNLNDTVTYKEFFEALGYDANEKIYFRTFDDQDKKAHAHKEYETVSEFAKKKRVYLKLKAENGGTRSVHFVVNGGGDTMEAVKKSGCCKAQFMEIDNIPFNEQIEKLNSFAFEPSIIIKSKKSLHCYWILKDGDIDKFSHIQSQLIQYFDSDEGLTQENHCMRLFGFYHHKAEPTEVKLIKFDPLMVYTQSELSAELPEVKIEPKKKEKHKTADGTADGAKIPHGEHFYYVRSKVGYYVAKLPDASAKVILNALYTDYTENCEGYEDSIDDFETRFMPFIEKCQENAAEEKKDPDYYRKALKVWKEVTGKEFDDSVTSWSEVEQVYLQSLDDDQRIEENYKAMKTDQSSGQSATNTSEDPQKTNKDIYKPLSMDDVEAFIADRKSQPHAIRTGIDKFDDLMHGGFINELYILPAPTGSGKSALMFNFAENAACNPDNGNIHVFYYALEMSKNEFLARGGSRYSFEHRGEMLDGQVVKPFAFGDMLGDVKKRNPATNKLEWLRESTSQYRRYIEAFVKKVNGKLTIVENGLEGFTASQIYNDIDKYMKEHPGERVAVFIDYLQILTMEENDRDETTFTNNASRKLKSLTVETGCTVFLISSMTKDMQEAVKGGGVIDVNSIRGSAQVGFNCGVVLAYVWEILEDLPLTPGKDKITDAHVKKALEKCNNQGYRTHSGGIAKYRNAAKGIDDFFWYYPAYNFVTDQEPENYVPSAKRKKQLLKEAEAKANERRDLIRVKTSEKMREYKETPDGTTWTDGIPVHMIVDDLAVTAFGEYINLLMINTAGEDKKKYDSLNSEVRKVLADYGEIKGNKDNARFICKGDIDDFIEANSYEKVFGDDSENEDDAENSEE